MNTGSSHEIGGYFGLDLPDYGKPFPASFIKFQSGRAALRAALECSNFQRIMLPAYICDAVIQAVADAGKIAEFYRLDDHLYPKSLPSTIPGGCALLYVNYFGLCEANISRLLRNLPPSQLIIDNTQALFEAPTDALATIYSPRKFFGVPDGGLLAAPRLDIKLPTHEDDGSIARMNHLLLRPAYTAREGYPSHIEAEHSLRNTKPLTMSRLTIRILSSIDMAAAKARRRQNFQALAGTLDKYNLYKWRVGPEPVPLCYPLVLNGNLESLKEKLAGQGIYMPTYWPNAEKRIRNDGIENALITSTLFVPCDQRYSPNQLDRVIHSIVLEIDKESSPYYSAQKKNAIYS